MLYLEELVDDVITREGQFLLGMDFITNSLGLSMKKIENIFKRTVGEYSKRRPMNKDGVFSANSSSAGYSTYRLPDNVESVRNTTFDYLSQFPTYMVPKFGNKYNYFDPRTKILKVFPAMSRIRVFYTLGYTLTKKVTITEEVITLEGEDEISEEYLKNSYRKGTITLTKNELTMVEVSRSEQTVLVKGVPTTHTIAELSGTLGTGTIDLNTKEMTLNLNDTTENDIVITYKPKYLCVEELTEKDYVFYEMFSLNLLEAIRNLRSQATQEDIHNIDLTNDGLDSRITYLRGRVNNLLRNTLDYSSLADLN